ncbi:MAG TPA: cell division protein FtsZ [Stellaceae bacterium]|nr:cell division protein FtsZ [Stellaceae bacterium]
MSITVSIPEEQELKPRIAVVGVGGAGGNAVNNMIRSNLIGCEFLVCNTDAQAMKQSLAERKIQLGASITRGLGAGSRPDVGRIAAEETLEEIMTALEGANMVFITAGMGGGTGTGAAPVIARAAREAGILTIGVVTKPFQFEGSHRMRLAEAGIIELQKFVDTLIIIPNQNLFRVANERTTFADAFKMADDVLHSGVRGVTDLMVMPGLINLDFADIRAVMSEMGKAMMGTGEAEGDRRAIDAAEAAISNPLLEDVSMRGARGVLINITGGPDMTLFEVDEAANRIREEVDPDANIIFGSTFDDKLAGRVRISVVATGIDAEVMAQPRPVIQLVSDRGQPAATAADAPAPQVAIEAPPVPAAAQAIESAAVKSGAFIAPKPLETAAKPAHVAQPAFAPDAYAAAAMENGGKAPTKPAKTRSPSLFERVTGVTRGRSTSEVAPLPRSAPPQQPAQPRLGPLDPADRLGAKEEDLLDIPAFLRRQAN